MQVGFLVGFPSNVWVGFWPFFSYMIYPPLKVRRTHAYQAYLAYPVVLEKAYLKDYLPTYLHIIMGGLETLLNAVNFTNVKKREVQNWNLL